MSALSIQERPPIVIERPSPAQGTEAAVLDRLMKIAAEARATRAVPPPFGFLARDIAAEVFDRWEQPCENAFEYLAARYPGALLSLVQDRRLEAADLTFAAEIVGRLANHVAVRAALVPLLAHAEAVVREGAIYGLTRHIDQATRVILERVADGDRSAAVRTAARDALDEG